MLIFYLIVLFISSIHFIIFLLLMPRYYKYRRSYVKKVYPRKRWASNVKSNIASLTLLTTTNSSFVTSTVCVNSVQSSSPTPVILKFGRFKLKGDVRSAVTDISIFTSANIFVVFVPEANALNPDLINAHPEYIIGWTTLSLDSGNSFSLTSPLKRNLNSGDSIQILWTVNTLRNPSTSIEYNFYYTVQFWTTSS